MVKTVTLKWPSLCFLTAYNGIDQARKDKYIHAYITLGAAWAGDREWLLYQPMIYDFQVIPAPILVSFVGLLVAGKCTFCVQSKVLVSIPNKNYTANDYNYRVIWQMSTSTTKSATITPELSRSQRSNLLLLWCRDAHSNENRLHVQKTLRHE